MVKPWYFDIYHSNALIPHCTSKYTMDLPSKKTRYNGTYSTIYIQYIWLYLIFSPSDSSYKKCILFDAHPKTWKCSSSTFFKL